MIIKIKKQIYGAKMKCHFCNKEAIIEYRPINKGKKYNYCKYHFDKNIKGNKRLLK